MESSLNVNFKTPIPSNTGSPFNQINIDHLIDRERQKLINKANKQK